jgi:hypothetical protein
MTYVLQGCVADGIRKCGSCVRKCGVAGREMRDELVDGTASIVTVLVGGAALVVMAVFSSMVMMIIR